MSLLKIQSELKAPKNNINSFGNYKYRSCEDILEAVKPLLAKYELELTISDQIVNVGDRYYIKATATITDGILPKSVTAYAREEETKKGMDSAQITGSASSYARKYALNGLFLIDDTQDPDTQENDDNPNEKTKPNDKPTETELEAMEKLIEVTKTDTDKFCQVYGINNYTELTRVQFNQAMKILKGKLK